MRIAVLYLGKGSGIGQFTFELTRVLSNAADVTCYLAAQNTMINQFESLPCRVRSFQMRRGRRALLDGLLTGREKSGIGEAILSDAPDIVLDTGSQAWARVVLAALRGKVPIAEIVHDVTPHPGSNYLANRIAAVIRPSAADALISLSNYSHAKLVRMYPHKKHICSKHGILLGGANVDVDAVAARRKRMLFFGRLERYKGLDVLVQAFDRARQSDADLRLNIVGSSRLPRKLLKRIQRAQIGLENRFVSDEEARQLLDQHGVIVLPYTSASQSGVAAIALANGIPCIVTDVGALPEQVRDGKNGIVVPPGDPVALADAMLRLGSDRELARAMASEAFKTGREDYSWQRIGTQLLRDLEEFLSAHAGR